MKKTVYNLKTGEQAIVAGVDAREYVKTGGWSYDAPEAQSKPKRRKIKNQDE
jgi:hypothetical protein